MVKAVHLLNDTELHFGDKTDPRWAVAFAYCEENSLKSWLFRHREDGMEETAYEKLGVTVGKRTVACGDWAVLL